MYLFMIILHLRYDHTMRYVAKDPKSFIPFLSIFFHDIFLEFNSHFRIILLFLCIDKQLIFYQPTKCLTCILLLFLLQRKLQSVSLLTGPLCTNTSCTFSLMDIF